MELNKDTFMTVTEVSEVLRRSRATVYRMLDDGELSYITVRGGRLIFRSTVEEYVEVKRLEAEGAGCLSGDQGKVRSISGKTGDGSRR